MFHNADGYILLVSQHYQDKPNHPYIWEKEVPVILRRQKENHVFTYCVSVAPVRYNATLDPLSKFRGGRACLPEGGHARDQYLVDFATEIVEKKFLKES
jgi:hypothetical protein